MTRMLTTLVASSAVFAAVAASVGNPVPFGKLSDGRRRYVLVRTGLSTGIVGVRLV